MRFNPANFAVWRALPLLRWVAAIMVAATMGAIPARAACHIPVLADYLDGFTRHPELILADAPSGGEKLSSKIRVLSPAGYGPLKAIEAMIMKANLPQKEAIGLGLARANEACLARDGEISHRIDDSVRRIHDRDVTRAYLKYLTPDEPPAPPTVAQGDDDKPARKSLDLDSSKDSLRQRDEFLPKR